MDFISLKNQQKHIRTKIETRIKSVLDHGQYIMGPEVFELEEKLANYVGVKNCVSCSSGTDALLLALLAKNIGPGDAVINYTIYLHCDFSYFSFRGSTDFCRYIQANI